MTYYKVEKYDEQLRVWRVIQKTFQSIDEAQKFANQTSYIKTRIMQVTEKGIKVMKKKNNAFKLAIPTVIVFA